MTQHSTNQQTGRKYGGSSSFTDTGTPSKAPRQDENVQEFLGAGQHDAPHADTDSSTQGISNRPAKEEHAFPTPRQPENDQDGADSVGTNGKQMGGNRRGV